MADFLSRLVERSAGTAPTARPVMAPLFAPGPPMPADPAPDELGIDAVAPDRAPPEPSPMARTTVLRETHATQSPPPVWVRAAELPASARDSGEEVPPAALGPSPVAHLETLEPGPPPMAPHPSVEQPPVEAAATPPTAENLTAHHLRIPARGEQRREKTEILSVPTPVLRPQEESVRPWGQDVQPRGSEEAARAPIVRISIDRIEVRAVVSSEPAPFMVQAPNSNRLSLEEYLKPGSRKR